MAIGIKHNGIDIVGTFVANAAEHSIILSKVRVVRSITTDSGNIEFALSPYSVLNIDGEITFQLCGTCLRFDTLPAAIETAYTTSTATVPTISAVALSAILAAGGGIDVLL